MPGIFFRFLMILSLALSALAQAEREPATWHTLTDTALRLQRMLASGDAPSPAEVERLRTWASALRADPRGMEEAMTYFTGPGMTSSGMLINALEDILLTAGTDEAKAQLVQDVGFDRLLAGMGVTTEGTPERAAYLQRISEQEEHLKALGAMAKNVDSKIRAFASGMQRAHKRALMLHMLVTGLGMVALKRNDVNVIPKLSPQTGELLTAIGAAMGYNFSAKQIWPRLRDGYFRRKLREEYRDIVTALREGLRLDPREAAPLISNLVLHDDPSVRLLGDAALDAMIAERSPETTRELLNLAMRCLQRDDDARARKAFEGVMARDREAGGKFAEIAAALERAMTQKQGLEKAINRARRKYLVTHVGHVAAAGAAAAGFTQYVLPGIQSAVGTVGVEVAGLHKFAQILRNHWLTMPNEALVKALTPQQRELTATLSRLMTLDKDHLFGAMDFIAGLARQGTGVHPILRNAASQALGKQKATDPKVAEHFVALAHEETPARATGAVRTVFLHEALDARARCLRRLGNLAAPTEAQVAGYLVP